MKVSRALLMAAALPAASAWGGLGHITVAYLATEFVAPETTTFFQMLLGNTTDDYLAGIATWADTIRYTRWGRFTANFHFIDAKDKPPHDCSVDLERDCKADGCVVASLTNYTERALNTKLSAWERNQAARFVVHFVGDVHQPLHDEDVARGGNGIHVLFDGVPLNLHHVWDSSILEKYLGAPRRQPYRAAKAWAARLANDIRFGKYREASHRWLDGLNIHNANATGLAWAREGNAIVCSHVLPEGPAAIAGKELGGEYYQKAAPVLEQQVARAGFRLAGWLDSIATKAAVDAADEL